MVNLLHHRLRGPLLPKPSELCLVRLSKSYHRTIQRNRQSKMSASTGFKARKTRRAPVACGACHSRKVRCNVALSGQPCANCEQDDVECVLHVSARGKYRRRRSAAAHEGLTAIVASKELRTNPAVPVQGPSFQGSNLSGKVEATALQSAFQRQDDYESPSNIGAYRNILEPTPIHGHRVPLYVGKYSDLTCT